MTRLVSASPINTLLALSVLSLVWLSLVQSAEVAFQQHSPSHLTPITGFDLKPMADIFVIKQDPKAFVGYLPYVSLYKETHFGLFLFDIHGVRDQLGSFDGRLEVKLRLYILWSEAERNDITLDAIHFSRRRWSDASMKYDGLESVTDQSKIGVTYTTADGEFLEFDVTDYIQKSVQSCPIDREECRYLSFKLSGGQAKWVKFHSRDSDDSRKHPALLFRQAPYGLSSKVQADAGVVLQESDRNFGYTSTLDIIHPTHSAYLRFDLTNIMHKIQALSGNMLVKLRVFCDWAEYPRYRLMADYVSLPERLDEGAITHNQVKNVRPGVFIAREEAYTGDFIDFDITPVVKPIAYDKRALSDFEIRLSNEQHIWIKIASMQYHDMSKRPVVVFEEGTWWEAEGRHKFAWLKYVYFVLTPFYAMLIGISGAVCLYAVVKAGTKLKKWYQGKPKPDFEKFH